MLGWELEHSRPKHFWRHEALIRWQRAHSARLLEKGALLPFLCGALIPLRRPFPALGALLHLSRIPSRDFAADTGLLVLSGLRPPPVALQSFHALLGDCSGCCPWAGTSSSLPLSVPIGAVRWRIC
eukprot:5004897-Heterocapsa_arctica.AAC.1